MTAQLSTVIERLGRKLDRADMYPVDCYRMPAEFERHAGTWLLWPTRPDNWRDGARPAQASVVQLAEAIGSFEPVFVGARSDHVHLARNALPPTCTVVALEYDDTWIRDTGPIYVASNDKNIVGLDWEFNSWGGLFDSWALDNSVPEQILSFEVRERHSLPYVFEGGAISVNGKGQLLTTADCLLSPERNPTLSKNDYETIFRDYFGASETIWLPSGLAFDETGGHVDNIAVFLDESTVALAWTDDAKDPQYERCIAAYGALQGRRISSGEVRIVKLPLPPPMRMSAQEASGFSASAGKISRHAGDKFSASYVNMYFVNGGIILPSFGFDQDIEALNILSRELPDRRIVQIASREFILGGGGPHCLTQQIPAST